MSVDADLTTDNGKVRLNIGDVESPFLVDNQIINAFLAVYPSPDFTQEQRIYNSTIDTLRYLKAKIGTQESARMREREGGVEVEVYGSEKYQNICDLLEWFEKNPPSSLGVPFAGVIFGGVSKTEIDRVNNDNDSRNGGIKLGWTDDPNSSLGQEDQVFIPEDFREI